MKHLHLFAAILLLAGSSVHAAESQPLYSCSFSSETFGKSIQDYSSTWTNTSDGNDWTMSKFNNNQKQWNYVRCGNKNSASVASITTDFTVSQPIGQVSVTIDAISANFVDQIYLQCAPTTAELADAPKIDLIPAVGTQYANIQYPEANLVYRISFSCLQGDKNGFVQVSAVDLYKGEPASTQAVMPPVFTPGDGATLYGDETVTLSCPTRGAVISYSVNGINDHDYDGPISFAEDGIYYLRAYAYVEGEDDFILSDTVDATFTYVKERPVITGTNCSATFNFTSQSYGILADDTDFDKETHSFTVADVTTTLTWGGSGNGYRIYTAADPLELRIQQPYKDEPKKCNTLTFAVPANCALSRISFAGSNASYKNMEANGKALTYDSAHPTNCSWSAPDANTHSVVISITDAVRISSITVDYVKDASTAITTPAAVNPSSTIVYDLQGRPVRNPAHGLYITPSGLKILK